MIPNISNVIVLVFVAVDCAAPLLHRRNQLLVVSVVVAVALVFLLGPLLGGARHSNSTTTTFVATFTVCLAAHYHRQLVTAVVLSGAKQTKKCRVEKNE